jgi:DNA-binding NarL/FixJ family response regulator
LDLPTAEMGGLEAMAVIRGECPDARIIVLANYGADVHALRALKAGARAYVLKTALQKDLLDTIRAVHADRKALSPEASFQAPEQVADDGLSSAEIRVLRLIANGNSDEVIAAMLSLAEDAVKGQIRSILCKLSAHDRTHAAMIGVKRGIVQL